MLKIIFIYIFKFQTAPREFTQIFSTHVIVDHCAIPVVFSLLPSKGTENYVRVFQAVRQLLPNFMPERVMSDFELSELNAIDQLFPESQKSGKAKLKYKINIKKYYIKYPRL